MVVEEVEGEEKVLGVERPAQRSKQVDARLAAHCRRTQAKKRRWCWRRWRRKREGSDPFPRIQSCSLLQSKFLNLLPKAAIVSSCRTQLAIIP